MKQVLQNLRTGHLDVAVVPSPIAQPGHLLIQSRASLVSAGTERTLVEFGKASLIAKAKAKPDKVRQVLDKIKADGLMQTLETVFSRLDEPLELGYCNAGVVLAVGEGVDGFEVGDRVISNGPHAEIVCVPKNLCAKIPDEVGDEEATFTVLGSIGLQGIRLLEPTLGETFVVTGLGLIGLMAVQILMANGCRVLGIDQSAERSALAREMGAEAVALSAGADPVAAAVAFSGGRGVDGVLITASAKTNAIVKQSAQMCRRRGRIVLVGVVGLELTRSDFYQKELTFQVSCSYGPGRYDPQYEERGHDYPRGFVRWTEQRNFEAILGLLRSGALDPSSLITERIEQARADEAYHKLTHDARLLGIILTYPDQEVTRDTVVRIADTARTSQAAGNVTAGVIGAGNFARMTGLPALAKTDARLACIADLDGAAGTHVGRKFAFERTTTDYHVLLDDAEINTVFIFTRHDLHAQLVLESLAAGKHVFVEKPLCLSEEELNDIRAAYEKAEGLQLMVGLNRRFSPHAERMKALLASRTQPMCMNMTVNAGVVAAGSWVHDPRVGGGRIIGEGCHWIDLMSLLAGAPVTGVVSTAIDDPSGGTICDDKTTITLTYGDGSIGTLHYFGNGDKSYPKETLEVFCDGKVLCMDNFRALRGWGWGSLARMRLRRMDKGHAEEMRRFVRTIAEGGPAVIPFEDLHNVMQATFAAVESARSGRRITLGQREVS